MKVSVNELKPGAICKPTILENGVRVMVPPHVETGTRIVVSTAGGTYVERVKG